MELQDNLQVAYGELWQAIDGYNEAHKALSQDLRKGIHSGRSCVLFEKATRRYEMREKAFNREVSTAIKTTGEIPTLAEGMLEHQRYNGFHAKGLAKIISMHGKTNCTEVFLEIPLNT